MSETPITPQDPDIPDEPPPAEEGTPETDDQPLGPPAEKDPAHPSTCTRSTARP